jgi:hypothetical protein
MTGSAARPFTWTEVFFCVAIGALFWFRLAHFDDALIYRHSYGEAQYAMWAKHYALHGPAFGVYQIDKFDPFSNYFPFAAFFAAAAAAWMKIDIVLAGRAVALFASAFAALGFFRLAKHMLRERVFALFATALFVAAPLNMYFSRLLYNDPLHLTAIIWLLVVFYDLGAPRSRRIPLLAVLAALVVFSKPTTVLFCGPVLAWNWWRRRGTEDRPSRGELIAVLAPVATAACFFTAIRLLFPAGLRVESNKVIWNLTSAEVLPRVHTLALQYYAEHGALLFLVPVAFVVCVFRGRSGARDMCLYLSLFAVFILALLPGAVIHHYYSLPVLVPFALLVAEAILVVRDRVPSFHPAALIVVFLLAMPGLDTLNRAFAPYYPQEVPFVAANVRAVAAPDDVLAVGRTMRILQYYLDLPWDNTVRQWRFANTEELLAYARQRSASVLILDKTLPGVPLAEVRAATSRVLYESDDHLVARLALDPPAP